MLADEHEREKKHPDGSSFRSEYVIKWWRESALLHEGGPSVHTTNTRVTELVSGRVACPHIRAATLMTS